MSPTRSALASPPCALLSVVVIRSSFPSRSRRETTQSTGLFVSLFPRIMFQHGGTLKASARADAERGASNPARPVRHQSVCYTPPRMYHVRQSRSEFFQTESERRSTAMSTAAVEARDTGGL